MKNTAENLSSQDFVQYARDYTNSLYQTLQPTTHIDDIVSDIQKQAYHEIHEPISKEQFNQAAQAFNEFLELPQDIKDLFTTQINTKK
jgi:hypothetical protein